MTLTLYRIDGTPRTYTGLFGATLPETYDDYGSAPLPPSNQVPAVVLLPHRSTVRLAHTNTVQLPHRAALRLPRT